MRQSLDSLFPSIANDPFWDRYLARPYRRDSLKFALHLAVFVEPYLRYILEGRKTVESRFSTIRCAPYRRVNPGDVIVLKRSGGPVLGLCKVSQTWYYELEPSTWSEIRREFTESLCAQDPEFWEAREHASFATLMRVTNPVRVRPFHFPKRDRRGWVVLHEPSSERLPWDA